MNDLELVTRLADGDASALDVLVRKYQDAVVRFARTVTQDEASALDAAQEAFIRLWRNPASFRGGSLKSWLFTVTRNVALNQIRSRKRHTARIDNLDPPSAPNGVVERTADAERLAEVRAFMSTLPEQERAALTLYAVEGLSQAEIAEVLSTTPGAVKQAILSARKKLREKFG